LYLLTTLYVDFKEPAVPAHSGRKKTQSGADDNSRFRSSCRDKIEFQFAVPKYARTTPKTFGARFRRGYENSAMRGIVNGNSRDFEKKFSGVSNLVELASKRSSETGILDIRGLSQKEHRPLPKAAVSGYYADLLAIQLPDSQCFEVWPNNHFERSKVASF
jgi:hypothetical protein